MARYKPRRLKLYNVLMSKGLLPIEAHEFSKMGKYYPPSGGRKQFPPALVALVKDRKPLLDGFKELSESMQWSPTRRKHEYRKLVISEYHSLSRKHTGNFFVSKDVHGKDIPRRISPWALYDASFYQLASDDQWDTPRSSRRQTASSKTFKSAERYKVKQLKEDIKFFNDKIARGMDPHGEFEWRKRAAEYQLKTGDYSY